MTTRSCMFMCVSAAEHRTAEQVSKPIRTKPRKHFPKKQSIMKYLPGLPQTKLLRTALETERRWFSKVIFKLNVTPNIARSSDPIRTVPPIVNGVDWGCIVREKETIIVLVLLAFNFISQRSHHSLTLTRSRLNDYAIVTLTPGDGTPCIKVESSAYQISL